MAFAIKLSPSAIEDLRETFLFYELKNKGLGDRFLNTVDDCLNKIASTPGISSTRYKDVKCKIVPKFPYLIHYSTDIVNSLIIVYRVFHTSRQPLWGK